MSVYRSVCESIEAALTEAVAAEQRKRFGQALRPEPKPLVAPSRVTVLCQRAEAFVEFLRYGDQLIIEMLGQRCDHMLADEALGRLVAESL